ncbi:MAG: AGE family epimerase/isomerase [candidate division KSB1 bacterium]|nr:AGE family epimerase/isomerase [candidate division KSB1 bacterium]
MNNSTNLLSFITMKPTFNELLTLYRSELLDSVVPFWTENAIDRRNGGICTCITDDGEIISEDKYLWSQLRAIWTFAALYNRIDKKEEWREIAENIYTFASRHGRNEKGEWVFSVSKEGDILQDAVSIFADGFAILGLTELAHATGRQDVIDLAVETYENVKARLAVPGSYGTEPYPLPAGIKAHAVSMIFSLAFNELGHYLESHEIIDESLRHAEEVMRVFLRPEYRKLYEYVNDDNSLIDSPRGRSVVPGHTIESMWFMIHIYRREGNDERIAQAIEAIRWHIEFGWDHEYGGILLAVDSEGGDPWWKFADTKLWWPHTEAIYALLLAHSITGETWCREWLTRVHDYAFTHFPVAGFKEWTQKLDRAGNKIMENVALPVKDPFHLPRALIFSIDVLREMTMRNKKNESL